MKPATITRVVLLLALVSLFTDISSEMLYPVMPLYLQSIGFSAVWIGLLEGVAQVVIGFATGYFGKLSDQLGTRMPFVRTGYLLSAVAKPMMILWNSHVWVLFARISDRLGKGIRTSARDAVLIDESDAENRGKVFGFHRGMDTLGAAIGPLLALIYLYYHPDDYSFLFVIAFVPAVIGSGLTFFIRENKRVTVVKSNKTGFLSFLSYWKIAGTEYKRIVIGLCFFALINSADSFLFMIAHANGIRDTNLILAYVFYNLIFAATAYPSGILADKIGMRNIFVLGLIFFVIAYFGFSNVQSSPVLFVLFGIYGLYGAFTDGVSKAWISLHCHAQDRGKALGFYKSVTSILAMVSSLLVGVFWESISPSFSILYSAIGGVIVIIYFLLFLPGRVKHSPTNK
ncbi:MAG TPA: MFS transporter [Bacteroidia bacterium]|nr:MFS transporter [Bacteroidia bacterium]